MKNEIEQAVLEVLEQDRKNRTALAMLLDEQREKEGHIVAISAPMGKTFTFKRTSSFVTSVSLTWVADRVRFAADLPLFKGKSRDDSKKVDVDKETIANIQQRQPDWRRQLPMALYLAGRLHHKFPPLLVVAYEDWVYDSQNPNWDDDKRAMRDSLSVAHLDSKGLYCDLDFSNTRFYALDGQHRLMAIKGLKAFLDDGFLQFKNQDGKPRGNRVISRDELIEEIRMHTHDAEGMYHEHLEGLMTERVGLEIIPAVAMGESFDESRLRLRRIFVDVNENAKRLTRGELVQLDENQAFRIVARTLMVSHEMLRGDRVELKTSSLSESSEHYTTLQHLVEIARAYLGGIKPFDWWQRPIFDEKSLGYWRPAESELEDGVKKLGAYFSTLALLPSHRNYLQGTKAKLIRSLDGEDSIFFRPMVQVALAETIGHLEEKKGIDPDTVVAELSQQEGRGQLRLRNPEAPWVGVLWDPINKTMRRNKKVYQELCSELLTFLLGGGCEDEKQRDDLRRKFAEARGVGDERALDCDGKTVPINAVRLPNPWRG